MCIFCVMNSVTKDFRTFGQKWGESQLPGSSGGTVSFSFATQNEPGQFGTFDSFITDKTFQAEIIGSLSQWEDVADIRFVEVPDSRSVDMRFGWREIDGKGGILGQTTVPSSGPLANTIVALDVDEDWFLSGDAPVGKIDFSSTVTHEIGHAIGIDHSESSLSLMNSQYSTTIFDLQPDDINAATAIYGDNSTLPIDIYRFYHPVAGGHLFTADIAEKDSVNQNADFNAEGIGFRALSRDDEEDINSIPIYRFFNTKLGSHFFTAAEQEKVHVMTLDNFIFEGIGFRAFATQSASTVPIHRFFNEQSGGHFFTADEIEREAVLDLPNFIYEGEAYYAFS